MMISDRKKPFGLYDLYKNNFQRFKGEGILYYTHF